jgi:hypothetical protein
MERQIDMDRMYPDEITIQGLNVLITNAMSTE